MKVDRFGRDQLLLQDDAQAGWSVVHQSEWRDRAGRHPELLHEELRLAERQAAGGADAAVEMLEVDHGVLAGNDEEEGALLVLEEEVLAVRAGDCAAQRLRLLDGEHRRMVDRRSRDPQARKIVEEVFTGCGHLGLLGLADARTVVCATSGNSSGRFPHCEGSAAAPASRPSVLPREHKPPPSRERFRPEL
jgi:hypothetical protein